MDPVSLVLLIIAALLVLGVVSRLRARAAMQTEWTIETTLDDARLEALIRQQLRGYLPGRIHGSVAEGQFSRRIRRLAVNLSSYATVVVDVSPPNGRDRRRSLHAFLDDCEVQTVAGMAHPAWSAPLAARRRLMVLGKALQQPAA